MGTKKTILLVEDEALIALNEKAILENRGFHVLTVYNGKKAIETAQNENIDLVLMDIDLGFGAMEGTEAAAAILQEKEVPIIFLTNHSEKEMVDKVKDITRYGYVLKTAGEFVLIEAITMAFELFKAFQEIKRKEQQLELAMDAEDHGYWDWDIDTNNAYFSPRYFTMLGYEPFEFPSNFKTWEKLLHPEDMQKTLDTVGNSIQTGMPFEMEFRMKTKSGGWKWIRGKGKIYSIDDEGKPHRAVGTHEDITARKTAEEKLQESEEKYRNLVELSPDGIITLNLKGTILSVNRAFLELTGYSREDFVGKNFLKIPTLIKQNFQTYSRLFTKIINGKPDKCIEFQWKHNKGEIRMGQAMVKLIKIRNNTRIVQGIIRDITKHKAVEENLKKALAEQSQLLQDKEY